MNGYSSPYWLTFKQAQASGGSVKRGEKAQTVVYASQFTKTETAENGDEVNRSIPFLKGYAVFNADQCEGLPEHFYFKPTPKPEKDRLEIADAFFAATGADIKFGGNRAYYSETTDHVQMPPFEFFDHANGYVATLAHELVHWTKHGTRLAREMGRKRWGDEGYAIEELVAELGSTFLCADFGIAAEVLPNSVAYVESWIKVLKNDKRAIFTAASHAQKAVDFLQAFSSVAENSEDQMAEAA